MLGKETNIGLTPKQLADIERQLPEREPDSEVVRLALTRLGDPYSQPKAGQDDFTDCSYLVKWVYQQLGIDLLRTAAEQARYSVENGLCRRRKSDRRFLLLGAGGVSQSVRFGQASVVWQAAAFECKPILITLEWVRFCWKNEMNSEGGFQNTSVWRSTYGKR